MKALSFFAALGLASGRSYGLLIRRSQTLGRTYAVKSLRRAPRRRSRIINERISAAAKSGRVAGNSNNGRSALSDTADASTVAHTPVIVRDDPGKIIPQDHPMTAVLSQPAVIIERQLETMNVLLGFEQANKYAIMDSNGNHLGYMAETQENQMGSMLKRQLFRTHRSFDMHIFDVNGHECLRIRRPFQVINSRIFIYDVRGEQEELIGEVQQQWHPWRRKYNLFRKDSQAQEMAQFARIDEPLLSWDFTLRDANSSVVGSVNRNFAGFAREIFTDTGNYILRMDAASQAPQTDQVGQGQQSLITREAGMSVDERAIMLATAVSVDFDYFSKLSGHGHGGFMPMPIMFPFGGSEPTPEPAESEQTGRQDGGVADAGTIAGADAAQGSMQGDEGSTSDDSPWWEQPEANGQAPEQEPWLDWTNENTDQGIFGDNDGGGGDDWF